MDNHEYFMKLALEEANIAFSFGEVPIGAVVVIDGKVITKAHNMKEQWKDATAHAEIVAIQDAVKEIGHWRHLKDAVLYVTLEPCPMCAGAIVQSRIQTLVYGAKDPKAGAVHSLMNLVQDQRLNHSVQVVSGVMEDECSKLMRRFFCKLREKRKQDY